MIEDFKILFVLIKHNKIKDLVIFGLSTLHFHYLQKKTMFLESFLLLTSNNDCIKMIKYC